jgi:5-(carboxyamino)imidazole ribonucleotide synthase
MNIGIIGAGQLGRMLALAGYSLGLGFRFLDRNAAASGGQVAPLIVGDFEDRVRLTELAQGVDVVTFDWENVSAEALTTLEKRVKVFPPPPALAVSQDRLLEKELFRKLAVPTPEFAAIDTRAQLTRAMVKIGVPGVLKTRRLGYDGKGQFVVHAAADIDAAWQALGGQPLVYEAFVNFTRELSIIGARSATGEIRFYPLCANTHAEGMLRYTVAPFSQHSLQLQAQRYLRRFFSHFDYTGILTIEFFVVRGGLLANEFAPRVHNSGHWTLEGAVTSQFENHLRAILGWPLGNTAPIGHSAMINFIGTIPAAADVLRESNAFYHHYGKEPRPKRKLGHCTINEPTAARRNARLRRLLTWMQPPSGAAEAGRPQRA